MTYRYRGPRYIANADGSLERDKDGDVIGSDRWYVKKAARKRRDQEDMRKSAEEKKKSSP